MRACASRAAPTPPSCSRDRIFTLLLSVQLVLLAVALAVHATVIDLLAPGFGAIRPLRTCGRTHPHHLSLPAAGQPGHALRRHPQCHRPLRSGGGGADPAQPFSMIMALALAAFFPTAGHAAAWGVLIAGVLEVLLLGGDAWRQGALPRLRWPRFDRGEDLSQALRARHHRLGRKPRSRCSPTPSSQAFCRRRAVGALLCRPAQPVADRRDRHRRRHVLLPEMARRIAAGDESRRAPRAEPRDRTDAAAGGSLPGRVPAGARTDHARAVRRGAFTAAHAQAAGRRCAPMRSGCCRSC
jgi:putative peptidoglycan lipid II flippase